ncbi:antirestriction protein ArdR [Erwinia psidii]|uniref:antirestriction protein ArdR n=1 Tax=Erwinia psidii TaxID=69224 RepID=UPI00226B2216|nr:antirestriction protein ArdR [Erwinia psidii]MCX8963113.1 antirestriction protein ArdR [Erwinia psidii]
MGFDFRKEDSTRYGHEVYRAFRRKGNHRWDTCVFTDDCGGYAAVFRHSFRKKMIEDGKEVRINVIDDEIVVAAPDLASFIRAKFPALADAKELKNSAFFIQLCQLATFRQLAAAWRDHNPEHVAGIVMIQNGQAYGWKNSLRDPHHESPGAIAVDSDGNVFEAQGGNDYEGAKAWIAFDELAISD